MLELFVRSDSSHTCPTISYAENSTVTVAGDFTFYEVNKIVSGAFTAATLVIILTLMTMHIMNMRNPNEQIKILKICLVMPFYSLVSFLSVCFPTAATYLEPWQGFYEAIALGYFFLLLNEWISPSDSQRDLFFSALRVPQKGNKPPLDGLEWYRKKWIAIFQYPVVALGVAIVTDITEAAGVYCAESNKAHFAHIWLEVISNTSITICVLSILQCYATLKKHIDGHRALQKLLAFKLLVGLTFLENIIFLILKSTNVLEPTSTLTTADIKIGIPSMLICIQTTLFALFFHYAYNVSEYSQTPKQALLANQEHGYSNRTFPYNESPPPAETKMSIFRILLAIASPLEIWSAELFIFTMRIQAERGTTFDNAGYSGGAGLEPLRQSRGGY